MSTKPTLKKRQRMANLPGFYLTPSPNSSLPRSTTAAPNPPPTSPPPPTSGACTAVFSSVSEGEDEDKAEDKHPPMPTIRENILQLREETRGTKQLVRGLRGANKKLVEDIKQLKMGLERILGAEMMDADALVQEIVELLRKQPGKAEGEGMTNIQEHLSCIASSVPLTGISVVAVQGPANMIQGPFTSQQIFDTAPGASHPKADSHLLPGVSHYRKHHPAKDPVVPVSGGQGAEKKGQEDTSNLTHSKAQR